MEGDVKVKDENVRWTARARRYDIREDAEGEEIGRGGRRIHSSDNDLEFFKDKDKEQDDKKNIFKN